MSIHRLSRVWGIVAVVGVLASPVHSQTYRATKIGPIPNSGGDGAYATAINNSGQIVGYDLPTEIADVPFLWQNGTTTALGLLGGFAGSAYGINNTGQIVGGIAGLTGSSNSQDAVLWANDTITNLSSTVSGFSSAAGINSSGQVVGTTYLTSSNSCGSAENAFIWSGGVISSLDPSASGNSVALAINDASVAVGYVQAPPACTSQAALFAAGTTTILPQLPGGDSSTLTVANAINNAGQIVGYMFTPDAAGAPNTAVLWYNGTATALGMGQALGINNTGQIVGQIPVTNGTDAAVWTAVGAKALDLNQLIDPGTPVAPLVLIHANAINDSGWIVAIGSSDGGVTAQSFLLQPETLSLQLTPTSLTFANQAVATTSAAQTVAVKNSGASAFNLNPIQVSGDYSQTNSCGTSVAADSSCAIQIKFAPTVPGSRTGVLTVASGGSSFTVNLSGTASISTSITTSAATVQVSTPVTLTWSSPGTTCTATGGSPADKWTGSLAASGSQAVTESISGKYVYGLTCTGGGQTSSAQVNVTVSLPSVTLTAAPTTVTLGQPSVLTWTSTFGTSCTASGGGNGDGWTGTKSVSGTASVTESAAATYTYTLVCLAGGQVVQTQAVVTVNAKPSSGGGGGALDVPALLSLLAWLAIIELRRRMRGAL